jgi:hypothetical protein
MTGSRHNSDVRAMLTAGRVRGLLDKTSLQDGPAKHHALKALETHSPDVRSWTRWAATATAVFPTAPLVVGFSVHALASGAGALLPLVGIVVGALAITGLAVGLWGVGQQALDLVVGMYLDWTPPPAEPGEAE